ncbi:citrate lyase subunit beta/citryl-CoA lyase [Rhizobium sp. PP-F2F-G48]|uniref:HpcH/HpaI aldolase/citrate lyase family protein n=1 Tax=Rhizobium sp. PP-F2F-G48 TaxID=2135651 RepID=UPI001053906B|nr:CoA ester lyase [Rhizobium sp. PP-F2F-G48]TCM46508.1 citrate lyase subunit beta/citryl-CoA lyase [Rhizobium sp. PP-F2F-G48]
MRLANFTIPLFVPGNRPERFEKAAASGADAIVIDLEDAVPGDAKNEARAALQADFSHMPVLVRVNGEGTPWHADDMAVVSKLPFAAIIVPKAELGGVLADIAANYGLPVLPLIETARGLSQARQIAKLPGVARLVFGTVDFCADLGCAHIREALLAARTELVLASRLAGLQSPIDGVTTSIDDGALVASDARYALDLGFGGKLAIHPRQIEAIRTGFKPTPSEVEWAEKVVASGDGAAAVNGAMVDEPVRIRARFILARAAD